MITLGDPSRWTDQPGTIDDLIADAAALDFPATKRLIYDWIGLGLLDHPARRTSGGTGGSGKALFPWTQRNTFRLLVTQRPEVGTIAAMCNVPITFWLWWGDDYAPTSQVQRALKTWAGQVSKKVTWQLARREARRVTDFFDDLNASRDQRDRLIELLAKIAHTGSFDERALTRALEEVFDPGSTGRVFGSGLASGSVDSFVKVIMGRLRGLERARLPAPLDELEHARTFYRVTRAQWARDRPDLALHPVRPTDEVLFRPEDVQQLFDRAGTELMFILGLHATKSEVEPMLTP
ncbi:MAG: hypothetical protein ACRD6W_12470 [Nitrososphaerales archaeon]